MQKNEIMKTTYEHPPIRPGQEQVALQAYYNYLNRGPGQGDELSDWLLAEQQVARVSSRPAGGGRPEGKKAVVKAPWLK